MTFARSYCNIPDHVIATILNSRKSFLFHQGEPWIKKDSTSHFDVTEGSFDGAEICELVGLYMLFQLNKLSTEGSIGLYRDDGLMVVRAFSGHEKDAMRKKLEKLFKDNDFRITVEIDLKCVDFLDVQFDLSENKYFPYRKPNDTPMYINKDSNHPPNVIKQIPKMTSTRLSQLSCNEAEFKKAAVDYQQVLENSGFDDELIYSPTPTTKRNRKRNILWYNPPFDLQVKTNVAAESLKLIDKHFPKHSKLHKILNRNCVKVSYSCMPSVASKISSHNKSLLQKSYDSTRPKQKMCNCTSQPCPLNGECLTPAIVYEGVVSTNVGGEGRYIGLSENFKPRYSDHKSSFKYPAYKDKTELSKYVWEQKSQGAECQVSFSILQRSFPFRIGSKKCDLCLSEKLIILKNESSILNKRDELISKCRHINKFLFKNFKYKYK